MERVKDTFKAYGPACLTAVSTGKEDPVITDPHRGFIHLRCLLVSYVGRICRRKRVNVSWPSQG
jgi:hypothetical protein